jgi:hypothetical protein
MLRSPKSRWEPLEPIRIIMERLLVDTQLHIFGMLDEHDLLCPSLVSKAFHGLVRERFNEGIRTPIRVIFSSVERLRWIKDAYSGENPHWLTPERWNHWMQGGVGGTYHKIALCGSIEDQVLVSYRARD